MKIANMAEDLETLRLAQETARAILKEDPDLTEVKHRGLRGEIRLLFERIGPEALN